MGLAVGTARPHFALDDVVASGKRIIPHCPFIAGYLRQHEGYGQHIDWPEDARPAWGLPVGFCSIIRGFGAGPPAMAAPDCGRAGMMAQNPALWQDSQASLGG
jgi:hypothetical protein